jgi:hypothetical protein
MNQNQSELTEKEQGILESYGIADDTKLQFFVRRPGALFAASLVTVGIYDIYWFYKNWVAVRDAGSKKISPFWRTVFTVFYVYPLFRLMNLQAKRYGYDGQSAGLLALGYVLVPYISAIGDSTQQTNTVTPLMYGAQLLGTLVSIFFLVTAQQAAIFANAKGHGEPTYEKFSRFEVGIVVVGVLLVLASGGSLLA